MKSIALLTDQTNMTPEKKDDCIPDPEVPERAQRRKYSAKYKLRILKEFDACNQPGEKGALLRREGLYSSNITHWLRQRDEGGLEGLTPKKRGRKASGKNPLAEENDQLRRKNEQLQKRLEKAELIIDVQKKISQILGVPLTDPEKKGSD